MAREKDRLQGEVAELGGLLKSQERLLELEKARPGQHWLCSVSAAFKQHKLVATAATVK